MWVLPEMDLFASIPDLKDYRGNPLGNSPELFNFDYYPKTDFHKALCYHVRYTHSLHKFDSKRFSTSTPKKGTSAYPQIFDPIDIVDPSSKWIISDTYDVLTSIKYIVEAEGCIIPDVKNVKNTQNGRQREVWGGKGAFHGGKRVQMLAGDDYGAISEKKLHKYAHGAKYMQLNLSQQLFNCDDAKKDLDKNRKIGDGICGMKMLKQEMR